MKLVCALIGFWRSYGYSIPISGHDFYELPRWKNGNVVVQRLKCHRCGQVSDASIS